MNGTWRILAALTLTVGVSANCSPGSSSDASRRNDAAASDAPSGPPAGTTDAGGDCTLPNGTTCANAQTCVLGKCSDGTKLTCTCSNGVAQCTSACPSADGGTQPDSGPSEGGPPVEVGSSRETAGLPGCPATLAGMLTAPLVDPAVLANLIPLGNSAPPMHTVPVDHVYFQGNTLFDGGGCPAATCWAVTPYFTPGDSTLVQVQQWTTTYLDSTPSSMTYLLDLGLCRGLLLRLANFTQLEASVLALVQQVTPACQSIPPKHPNEAGTETCTYATSISLKGGRLLGATGGAAYPEVWAFNYNVAPDPAVDWTRYGYDDYAYATCLFDLYAGSLASALNAKFGNVATATDGGLTFTPRTVAPVCGTVHQTIVGTAQGDWFATSAGGRDNPGSAFGGADLSLIHDNFDPTVGKFSIGGLVLVGQAGNAGVATFTPLHSGQINREFSELVPGSAVYCYQADGAGVWQPGGKLLLSLADAHHLTIENQVGSCGLSESFQTPVAYER